MSQRESLADFDDLSRAFLGTKINRGADGGSAHVGCLLHRAKHDLVKTVGIRHQLVVIDFYNERNFMSIGPGYRAQHSKRGSHSVAAAFHRQFHDFCGVEVVRVLAKTESGRMLDPLVHWQNRNVPRPAEAAVLEYPLQAHQHAIASVREAEDPVHSVRTGKMQPLPGNLRVGET